jgi:hypothetical protein
MYAVHQFVVTVWTRLQIGNVHCQMYPLQDVHELDTSSITQPLSDGSGVMLLSGKDHQ